MPGQPFRLPTGGLIDRMKAKTFVFEGQEFRGFDGDTVTSAVLAQGRRVIGKSLNHKRPRGIYGMRDLSPSVWQDFGQTDHDALMNRFESCKPAACDIVVVGGGAAGLTAALVAADMGAHVVVLEKEDRLGGWLLHEQRLIEGDAAQYWAMKLAAQARSHPKIEIFKKTEALCLCNETEVFALKAKAQCPQSLSLNAYDPLRISAKHIVWAGGACEQPLAFEDNDCPGIMLSSAMRAYLNRYGVYCGHRIAVVTNNDTGYITAFDLIDAGCNVIAVIDERPPTPSFIFDQAEARELPVIAGGLIQKVHYARTLEGLEVMGLDGAALTSLTCDAIAMSGGLTPTTAPAYQNRFAPAPSQSDLPYRIGHSAGVSRAGGAIGAFAFRACVSSGAKAGAEAAIYAGFTAKTTWIAPKSERLLNTQRVLGCKRAFFGDPKTTFMDLENDLTEEDLRRNDPLRTQQTIPAIENLRGLPSSKNRTRKGQGDALYGPYALGISTNTNEG